MAASERVVTLAELAEHKKPDDLWIAVNGKVYDISSYSDLHPGGVEVLHDVGGMDASEPFDDVGHSDEAVETLETFLVGTLVAKQEARVRPVYTSTVVLPPKASHQQTIMMAKMIAMDLGKKALKLAGLFVVVKFLWPELDVAAVLSDSVKSMSSFWKGVVLSSAAFGACFWIVGKEVNKSLDMTEGLRRYPPIMKPTKALRGPRKMVLTSTSTNTTDASQFHSWQLTERVQLTPNTYKFILSNVSRALLILPLGQHIQIRADVKDETVLRSYTPSDLDLEAGRMELTIKVYPNGKMGNYLLNLPIGGSVELRGPIGQFKNYHRGLANDLAMIAGGTGITPMWQMIKAICADTADNTRITLLYANQTQRDIILRKEIDALATRHPNKLVVHYFIERDENEDEQAAKSSSPSWAGHRGFITAAKLAALLAAASPTSKYLMCGPPPMINAITKGLVAMGCDSPKTIKQSTDQVFVF